MNDMQGGEEGDAVLQQTSRVRGICKRNSARNSIAHALLTWEVSHDVENLGQLMRRFAQFVFQVLCLVVILARRERTTP